MVVTNTTRKKEGKNLESERAAKNKKITGIFVLYVYILGDRPNRVMYITLQYSTFFSFPACVVYSVMPSGCKCSCCDFFRQVTVSKFYGVHEML